MPGRSKRFCHFCTDRGLNEFPRNLSTQTMECHMRVRRVARVDSIAPMFCNVFFVFLCYVRGEGDGDRSDLLQGVI